MSSCSGLGKVAGTLEGVRAVQAEVVKAVGTGNVRVNVHNDRYMTVGIVNSPLKALPTGARRAKAFEIAQLAYRTYPGRASLEQVGVVYVVHRSYFLFFNVNDATDSFRFSTAELEKGSQQQSGTVSHDQRPPNDALQLTKPAQAMELRS